MPLKDMRTKYYNQLQTVTVAVAVARRSHDIAAGRRLKTRHCVLKGDMVRELGRTCYSFQVIFLQNVSVKQEPCKKKV